MPRFARGLTLIELMITIIIASILLSIGIPSFNHLIQRNRLTTYANEMVTTVNLARSEAIKRGTPIIISSTGGTNWSQGWDLNIVSTDELLRTAPALDGDSTFTGSVTSVTFNSRGFTTLGALASWNLCNADVETGRRITIAITGRISVTELSPCP